MSNRKITRKLLKLSTPQLEAIIISEDPKIQNLGLAEKLGFLDAINKQALLEYVLKIPVINSNS